MNDKELSALKALAEVATPGPWFVQQGDDYNFMNMTAISTEDRGTRHLGQLTDDSLLAVTFHQSQPWVAYELDDLGDANSAYIAAANPTAILSLISRVEQAEAEVSRCRAQGGNTLIGKASICVCGEPETEDFTHRTDGPCYVAEFATPARDVGGLTGDKVAQLWSESKGDSLREITRNFAAAIEREVLATKEAKPVQADVRTLDDIASELEDAAIPYEGDFADTVRGCAEELRALATSPAPSVKQEAMLVPKWAGKFSSHADWVNRAKRVLSVPSHKPPAVCVDAKGRRCFIGADMARARDEDAFPVRYFWECELAAPSASQGEVSRLREIARLIGAIYVYGNFKAETFNERALEKLLREQGVFFESVAEYEASLAAPAPGVTGFYIEGNCGDTEI